jgi:hypothetical protein
VGTEIIPLLGLHIVLEIIQKENHSSEEPKSAEYKNMNTPKDINFI